jgi:hypothetical protein
MTLGTAALAAPSDNAPCIAQCTPNGACGSTSPDFNEVKFLAQGGTFAGLTGAAAHAQADLNADWSVTPR